MNLILRKTKSDDRFQKMRSIYLGNINQKHKVTGYYGQRDEKFVSWGFNQKILKEHIEPYIYRFINKGGYIKNITLIDDFTFEGANYFIANFKVTKITCAFIIKDDKDKENIKEWFEEFIGLDQIKIIWIKEKEYRMPKLNKKGLLLLDKKTGEQKYTVNKKWDLGGLENMDCNLIVSNPAYGSIGANITDVIRLKVDYKEFINLLPANDYKRNNKDLFKYQSDMKVINDGFTGDAVVTTHVARIHRDTAEDPAPNINMTIDEFEISNYTDKSLIKYFSENRIRKHYAIDNATQALIFTSGLTNKTTTIIDHRFIPHKHLAYSKNTDEYKWNVLKSITLEDLKQEFEGKVTFRKGTALNKYVITFNTEIENTNIDSFIYSKDGFRFMSKIATAVNVDSTVDINKILPKVDWTRSWTVEEILRDYGYTEEEIAEIMADLDNFKGMDD